MKGVFLLLCILNTFWKIKTIPCFVILSPAHHIIIVVGKAVIKGGIIFAKRLNISWLNNCNGKKLGLGLLSDLCLIRIQVYFLVKFLKSTENTSVVPFLVKTSFFCTTYAHAIFCNRMAVILVYYNRQNRRQKTRQSWNGFREPDFRIDFQAFHDASPLSHACNAVQRFRA